MRYLLLCLIAFFVSGCSNKDAHQNANYQYIEDLQDKRVATMMGSSVEACLEAKFPRIEIDRFETVTDLVQSLKQHRCEGIAVDGYGAHYLNVGAGGGLVALDNALDTMGLAAAFPKNDQTELREQFNAFLRSLRKSGLHQQIVDKWINHFETATLPQLDLPQQGDPILVGTCMTLPPTSYLRDQEQVGLDMELIRRFSVYVNRPIHLLSLNFTSLVTSLTTGKIDMVISGFSVTKERAERVDFSDPYLIYPLTILVREGDKSGGIPAAVSPEETEALATQGLSWLASIRESIYNNLIKEHRYEMVLRGLRTTLIIAFFSALVGTLLGAFICFLRMRRSRGLRFLALTYINLLRGTPVLVLLLIMFYVVFNQVNVDPVTVSVITFALNFSAYVSEMFRTSIEGVDIGQTEAGIALGFSKFRTFYHIVLPQAFKNVLPVYKGELISMVKMTSIVGYIAVEDLTKVSDIIRSRTFDALFPLIMVAILYFIIAWLFGAVLDGIGRRFN